MSTLNFSEIKIIGLTGMSGAGKTTANAIFNENGFSVINCDETARIITSVGSCCLKEIEKCFSDNVIDEIGKLDRRKTAGIIFNDSKKKQEYEKIIFPYIMYNVLKQIENFINNGKTEILIDAPTLFESGVDGICTDIVSVITDKETSIQRITRRDGISQNEAIARLSAQKDEEFYESRSGYVVNNNKSIADLKNNIMEIIKSIRCNHDS